MTKEIEKEDHRTRITKAMIRSAVLRLLETKPVGAISISELCREADISRSTFYAHYDSPEDVLRSIEAEVVSKLISNADTEKQDVYTYMLRNCEISYENRDFCLMVARDHAARAAFRKKLLELTSDIPEITNFPDNPTREDSLARFKALAVAEGCAGIVNDWHERGMAEPPELVAKAVSEFVTEQRRINGWA